jgi:hypothetical protein
MSERRARRGLKGRVRKLAAACVLVSCLSFILAGASASASTSYVDGISDQSLPAWDNGFSSSYFAGFFHAAWVGSPPSHVTLARYVVQWNVMSGSYPTYRSEFESWLTDIASIGLTPDLALTSYDGVYPGSSAEYKTRLQQVLGQARTMGHSIRYVEAWNEPNNQGHESAVTAAHFTNEAYSACSTEYACTIIAGNLEDSPSVGSYEDEYRTHLSPVSTIWGVHPYSSVEERSETPIQRVVEHLPNGGVGDQLWITEVAARKCKDFNGNFVENGIIGQAERAKWLVNTLIHNRRPEHVFYYEFLLKEHKQPSCQSEGADNALYLPGNDPNAPDYPRPAASYIWNGKTVPWGYTGGSTGVQPQQATLTGSVYPGGFLVASYHFEYGTTTGYGSYSPEGQAGSGTGQVGVGIALGLAPGTSYHYRLVAWNSEGSTVGEDHTLTTPGPVEAVTGAASGVQDERATLEGTVNPRGYDAKYYFQYGTSISYTSSTSEGDAGTGMSPVPVMPATVTGLEAGLIYHYRLVATSGGVTSYGSDQTFATVSTPAVYVNGVSTQDAYFRGTNGAMWQWQWESSSHKWYLTELGGQTGGEPWRLVDSSATAFVEGASGNQMVYFRGTNGAIWQWQYEVSNHKWYLTELGGQAASSPTAYLAGRNQMVYFRGTNGAIWQWQYEASNHKWYLTELGGQATGRPAAFVEGASGNQMVYFRGTNGAIWQWQYEASNHKWYLTELGGQAASSPTGYVDEGNQMVYFRGTNGAIWQWQYEASNHKWYLTELGGQATGTLAAFVYMNGATQDVYFRGTNGAIWQWQYEASNHKWYLTELGGQATGSPTAYIDEGNQMVYFWGTNGAIWQWQYEASNRGWYLTEL